MKKILVAVFGLGACCAAVAGEIKDFDGVWQINNGKHNGVDIVTSMVVDVSKKKSAMCPHDASTVVISALKVVDGKLVSVNPNFGTENTLSVKGNHLVLSNGDKWVRASAAKINQKCVVALHKSGFLDKN